jgi:hypothetical protein
VRYRVLLHVAKRPVRERHRSDEHRQHRLEDAVAVEEPHVPRGESAGSHLHDEHAHRDDEAGEPDARRHDGSEHCLRRSGRIAQSFRDLEDRSHIGHEGSGQRADDTADDGKDPQAAAEILPGAKEDVPGHDPG